MASSTSLLSSTEHTSSGGRSRHQTEWGNLAMRTSEEPTDCPIVSKITHRYVPDSPIESDRIMRLPAGVPEGARKPAEEYENNKELIIEKERDIRGVSSHIH